MHPRGLILIALLGATCSIGEPGTARASDGTWVGLYPPPPRRSASAILDPVRHSMFVFGGGRGYMSPNCNFSGCSSQVDRNDTWELSLAGSPRWSSVGAGGSRPAARHGQAAIYDPVRDRMIVFGGYDGTAFYNDVWAVNLTGAPVWTPLSPSGSPPAARAGHSAIYDPTRDRIVIHGGVTGPNALADTWQLSLAGGGAWSRITPAGAAPLARGTHGAVYDPVRDRMVIFGGVATGTRLNDTWALVFAPSPAWVAITPTGTLPSARFGPAAAYDGTRDRLVVFGGYDGAARNDVWVLPLATGSVWTQVSPTGTPPQERWLHNAVYDPVGDELVTFAGQDTALNSAFDDVNLLALSPSPHWLANANPPAPSPRRFHSAIVDPTRDRMLVFGGEVTSGTSPFANDLWALSLAGTPLWTEIHPAGTPPTPRFSHTAILDRKRDRMIVFGGSDVVDPPFNDVWALSLSGAPNWQQLSPLGTPPAGRFDHTAIYDPVGDRMIVYGGTLNLNGSSAEVWALALSGTPTWAQLAQIGLSAVERTDHASIYDPIRQAVLSYGGRCSVGGSAIDSRFVSDLELRTLSSNVVLSVSDSTVFADQGCAAVYDGVEDRMVVFDGGHTVGNASSLSGQTWGMPLSGIPARQVLAPGGCAPPLRMSHTVVSDQARDRAVIFGGWDGFSRLHDSYALTWARSLSTPDRRPSRLTLEVPRPNPSRGDCIIGFSLPAPADVTLEVFDALGRLVKCLEQEHLGAGEHARIWAGIDTAGHPVRAGVYFVRLEAGGQRLTRRVVSLAVR